MTKDIISLEFHSFEFELSKFLAFPTLPDVMTDFSDQKNQIIWYVYVLIDTIFFVKPNFLGPLFVLRICCIQASAILLLAVGLRKILSQQLGRCENFCV